MDIKDFPVSVLLSDDLSQKIEYISWKDIENIMSKEMYDEFCKFMNGQTCLQNGAYICDVENFLRPKQKRFFD